MGGSVKLVNKWGRSRGKYQRKWMTRGNPGWVVALFLRSWVQWPPLHPSSVSASVRRCEGGDVISFYQVFQYGSLGKTGRFYHGFFPPKEGLIWRKIFSRHANCCKTTAWTYEQSCFGMYRRALSAKGLQALKSCYVIGLQILMRMDHHNMPVMICWTGKS